MDDLPSATDTKKRELTVRLGDTLDLVLLLDGVGVGRTLGGVDQLVGEALGDRLDVAEGRHAGAGGQQVDGLVDTAERRHIDGLTADGTGGTHTGAVLTRASVLDRVNEDLNAVVPGT